MTPPFFYLEKTMPCHHPKWAWQSQLPNENGKHPLRMQFKKTKPDFRIGCGKCLGCHTQKKMEWAIRMVHEAQFHDRNCFITLTYENAPEKINQEDPTKFIKRLRKHSTRPIRYFLTGEYGDKTRRPHYHAIIFGEDFLGGAYDISDSLYGNKILDGIWKHGITGITEFSEATALYVAGYTAKKIDDHDTFNIMSRKPPLGRKWYETYKENLSRLETVIINGSEMPIPSTYIRWLDQEEVYPHIKENRRENAQDLNDKQLNAKELNAKSLNEMKRETL